VVRNFSLFDMVPDLNYSSQDIASAAARAAQNPDDGVFMGRAWRAEREALYLPTKPGLPPTLQEIRAAVPSDGLSVNALIRLFWDRLEGRGAIDTFIKDVKTVARQDPITNLIFSKM
jgi:hypothetical protein